MRLTQIQLRDFRAFSGLDEKESLKILVIVLRNLLAEQEEELAKLTGPPPAATGSQGGAAETPS